MLRTGALAALNRNTKSLTSIAFVSVSALGTLLLRLVWCDRMIQHNLKWIQNVNRFYRLIASCLLGAILVSAANAVGETETLAWQDLLPELDDTLMLNDGVPWGERVRLDLNDKAVRIPGFIVPVDFEETQLVTRFLLVPYFGACIHEPAPPPNQTIYAEFEPGYPLETLWDPIWVEGKLSTLRVEEDLATASYTLIADKIEPYEY